LRVEASMRCSAAELSPPVGRFGGGRQDAGARRARPWLGLATRSGNCEVNL